MVFTILYRVVAVLFVFLFLSYMENFTNILTIVVEGFNNLMINSFNNCINLFHDSVSVVSPQGSA